MLKMFKSNFFSCRVEFGFIFMHWHDEKKRLLNLAFKRVNELFFSFSAVDDVGATNFEAVCKSDAKLSHAGIANNGLFHCISRQPKTKCEITNSLFTSF